MAIAVIRVKSVALIVEGPVEPDLEVYDESGIASRRAISVIISIAILDLQHKIQVARIELA